MSRRATTWVAWSMWAISVLLFIADGVLTGLYKPAGSAGDSGSPAVDILIILVLLAMITVGALVASRQPANAIGWIFCAVGLTWNLGNFAGGYTTIALSTTPAPLPGGTLMAWVDNWTLGPSLYSVLILLFLLFPTGKPLTPRWRPVLWITIATGILFLLVDMFSPGPFIRDFPQVENPLGIPAIAWRARVHRDPDPPVPDSAPRPLGDLAGAALPPLKGRRAPADQVVCHGRRLRGGGFRRRASALGHARTWQSARGPSSLPWLSPRSPSLWASPS